MESGSVHHHIPAFSVLIQHGDFDPNLHPPHLVDSSPYPGHMAPSLWEDVIFVHGAGVSREAGPAGFQPPFTKERAKKLII
jgi:hypothetical protein